HGRDGLPLLVGAVAEGRHATGGTEAMSDPVGVERVGREVGLGSVEAQPRARHHPEEGSALAADRAVALDRPIDATLHLESDSPAMASTMVGHRRYTLRRRRVVARSKGDEPLSPAGGSRKRLP